MNQSESILNSSQVNLVYRMIGAVSSVCDNAQMRDNVGFSKADLIGHYISELPLAYFDEEWALTAIMLVAKYQRQIGDYGFSQSDITSVVSLLSGVSQERVDQIRYTRKDRQLRRVLLLESGEFEIYFPNKSSMSGFDDSLHLAVDWMAEKEIPHGYAFIVKQGARLFVQNVVERFGKSNWFIPAEALDALYNTDLDSIDVSRALVCDMYVLGDVNNVLTLKWPNKHQFLNIVRKFSDRHFDGISAWKVRLKTPEDVDLLQSIISGEKIYVEGPIANDLAEPDALKNQLVKEAEERAARKAESAHNNRPRCVVSLIDEDNKLQFKLKFTDFSYDFVNWIKSNLTSKEFIKSPPHWLASAKAPANIIALESMLDHDDWVFDDDLKQYIKHEHFESELLLEAERESVELSLKLSSQIDADSDFNVGDLGLNGSLLAFQNTVLQYSTIRKNMMLADDMGLGKTLSALACAVLHNLTDKVVIGCPAIARLTWRNEVMQWLPNASVYLCLDAKNESQALNELEAMQAANFVVVSYNKAHIYKSAFEALKPNLFIADESQYLKTPTSQRTKACLDIAEASERVYLLSGTPIKNRPIELIPQLKMLKVLDTHFNGETKFKFDYCNPQHNGFGWNFNGSSNLTELREMLRKTCMIRRIKDDVLEKLPPKLRMRIPVEITNRKAYDHANTNFAKAMMEKAVMIATIEGQKAGLNGKQLKDFVKREANKKVQESTRAELLVHIGLLRKLVSEGLVDPTCEWVTNFCETQDSPLVVFAYHKEAQKQIFDQLSLNPSIRVGKIDSAMSAKARKQTETDFQSGMYDVIVCSVGAASTNITLTRSHTVLTVEYSWVPSDLLQAEDRCRRIGTSFDIDSINCYYMHAENTVDDDFWNVLQSKFKLIEKAMNDDNSIELEEGDEEVKGAIIQAMMEKFNFVKG
ncbi:DEAD/DEAH box helicase (plasmid) [Shewanella xiamenensis]|uniref:DEAD/DEAH box helicase n=1 Tax=Shewanella xiamenensis TaxID=332186 RepID=A0ABT6UER2_9GAMM|nr:DEAD/DEAH box helicase [Shewanella xiamenensis]MDI5832518.1 DEAD/DEAH box helicase [Shewanella xiamenensis]WHF57863.1 DEAD/DEAH box helicase [Shewanella xiamenensis]